MNPYILNTPQAQDPQGLNPVFQNANSQQQFMNQQLGQGNQLAQYQSYPTSQGGLGNLALAQALRKKTPNNSDMPNPVSPYDAASLNNPAAQTDIYGAN